ncbi:MAG: hypothetical protein WAU63_08740 [Methylovirgula sp.]
MRRFAKMQDLQRVHETKADSAAARETHFAAKLSRFAQRNEFVFVAAVISIAYCIVYFSYPGLPGKQIAYPLGWLGWWDQSQYFASAQAFGSWNLTPGAHWYPFGYDLLVTPFALVMRQHPFFLPDLGCLLVTSWLFLRIAERYGLPRWAQLLALAIGLHPSVFVFQQYVIPWNTTLGAALLMGIAYLYMRIVDRGLLLSNGCGLAALGAALMFTRPSDCFALVPIAIHVAAIGFKRGNMRAIVASAAALLCIVASGLWLYVTIYGWQKSGYMQDIAKMGFPVETIPRKAYEMFVSPVAFYGGGIGIIPYMPWVAIGLLGLFYTMFSQARFCLVNIAVVLLISTYLAFPDFWPGNIWYNNCIHYLVWPFLMCALFGAVMLRDLWRSPSVWRFAAVLVPVIAVAAFKYARVDLQVEDLQRADNILTVRLAAPAKIDGGYVNASITHDQSRDVGQYVDVDGRRLHNIYDYHIAASKGGFSLVFVRPQFAETISISAPANASFGADAQFTPFRNAIEVRAASDWKPAADRFMY